MAALVQEATHGNAPAHPFRARHPAGRHRRATQGRRGDSQLGTRQPRRHGDALDSAELVISELLTNAVQHAGDGPITLGVRLRDRSLWVEVSDSSTTLPRPTLPDVEDEHGRGLFIVDAIAARHAVELTPTGKRCWAEIALPRRRDRKARPVSATIITGGSGPDPRAPCEFTKAEHRETQP
ncbi:ATP-binding protein [Streptomyces sp. M19]